MANKPTSDDDRRQTTTTPVVQTKVQTPAETQRAAEIEASNRAGYDQTKGPSGKDTHKAKVVDTTDDEIRDAIDKAIEGFKGRADKPQVVGVLRTAAELLNRSESWVTPRHMLDYDPDDLDDPRANPQGARPAPRGATRADEHTAPEPDSLGNIADRKAAEAGLDEDDIDVTDVPPADEDAVRAKRGMEKSVEQFGTAGGHPLSRAEHKDDPKPKK